ncbi:hypothetical protein HHI36_000092 [Cryptolaemus montrouzieri]|uniref:Peptidase S1 domain-containing protein n=1 Tax=Cryptolaemus montrouzieri TaxID=559131 RepID=A0ABD2P3Q3_9CUCU
MFRIVNGGEVRNKKPIPPDVSSHKNLNLLPRDCGNILTNGKILNGNQTSQYEFPWQALLSYRFRNGPQFQCGGTVINDRYILTAAHCITGVKYPLIGVRVGEHNLLTKPDCETIENKINCAPDIQDMIIESVIPHPLYNRTALINDIGLIRLASRMNFVESVAPICLPISREAANYDFSGRKGIVTGFGTTEKGVKSMVLLKVYVPYVEQSVCKKVYEKRTRITHLHLCAGGQNQQDSCGGDSGGPLQVALDVDGEAKYVQQGIVSFGPRLCGSEGYPGVYTRVPYYMDWILDNISF